MDPASEAQTPRPLSPHLQVYKPQLTSVLSITHRGTGIALAIGTVVLMYWLLSLAAGPAAYASASAVLGSVIGQLVLVAFTFSFCYHLCNGMRHLFWDIGMGFEMETVYASGKAVVVVSIIMTVVAWIVAKA